MIPVLVITVVSIVGSAFQYFIIKKMGAIVRTLAEQNQRLIAEKEQLHKDHIAQLTLVRSSLQEATERWAHVRKGE